MGFGPCCVDTRKARKLPPTAATTTSPIVAAPVEHEYQGRREPAKHSVARADKPRETSRDIFFENKLTAVVTPDTVREAAIENRDITVVRQASGLTTDGLPGSAGVAINGSDPVAQVRTSFLYPVGYEPIAIDSVLSKYMTQNEVRLHQLQKERNKLLEKTPSEMINDHTARGLTAKSSSAELMKRAQSPDE